MTSSAERSAREPSAGCFDFGGVPVSLACDSRRWRAMARERYRDFLTPEPPVWRAVYTVRDRRVPEPRFLCDSRRHPMRSRRDGARLHLSTATFEIELDHGQGTADLCGDGFAGSPSTGWPCIADLVDGGHGCFGHGRGMCQCGTHAWSRSQLAIASPRS